MAGPAIPLRFARPGLTVRLRPLTGADERAVSAPATGDALRLLDALIVRESPDGAPTAAELAASDRDQLLAAIYAEAFGDRIDSTLPCRRCGHPFDLHFSLTELRASLDRAPATGLRRADDGMFVAGPAGPRFRLPTGADELALSRLPAEEAPGELLRRCGVAEWPGGAQGFQALLDEVAPLLDLDLTATCPECAHHQTVHFDLQSFLLTALLGERPRLLLEIHRIASAYGWSLDQILGLTRSERRRLVEWIEGESPTRWTRR